MTMNRRDYLATIGAVTTLSFAGCSGDDGGDGGPDSQPVVLSNIQHKIESDSLHYLTGEAENVSDTTQQFQVRIDWLDADDVLLGESFTQIRADIEPGQTRMWDSTYYNGDDHGTPDDWEVELHIY